MKRDKNGMPLLSQQGAKVKAQLHQVQMLVNAALLRVVQGEVPFLLDGNQPNAAQAKMLAQLDQVAEDATVASFLIS